jgi:hypothetical protein
MCTAAGGVREEEEEDCDGDEVECAALEVPSEVGERRVREGGGAAEWCFTLLLLPIRWAPLLLLLLLPALTFTAPPLAAP